MPANALMQPRIDGTMQATPRNALLGYIADALNAANSYANKPNPSMPIGKANPPLSLLASALGIGDLGATADNLSYGRNLTQGQGMARQMLPETANALLTAGPLAAKFPKQAAAVTAGLLSGDTNAARAAIQFVPTRPGSGLWHGTSEKDEILRTGVIKPSIEGNGVFFTDDPMEALEFARMKSYDPSKQKVIRSAVDLKSPYVVNAMGELYDPDMMKRYIDAAKSRGADGLVVRNIQNFEGGPTSNTTLVFDR